MTIMLPKPIYTSPKKIDAETPFDPNFDLFGRKAYADRLTNLINRLPDGGVIAIDAPWGEGKSWFGENWRNQLKKDGYKTAFINAFERDYVEDPFVMLAAELLGVVDGKTTLGKSFIKSTAALAKTLAPVVFKTAVNVAGKVIGTAGLADDVSEAIEKASDSIADAGSDFLVKRIKKYDDDQKTVNTFKSKLYECAAALEKPIVIFIDELDRCRPDFAVKTIERIKHFFEIKNVVFVLLINKTQLHSAIKGLYGDINADDYLGKFLHLTVKLPKKTNLKNTDSDSNTIYCKSQLHAFAYSTNNTNEEYWANRIGIFATFFDMSLRDIERCVTLYAVCNIQTKASTYSAWTISLKVKKPDLFQKLKQSDQSANLEAAKLLEKLCSERQVDDNLLNRLVKIHYAAAQTETDATHRQNLEQLGYPDNLGFRNWTDMIPLHCNMIDCT